MKSHVSITAIVMLALGAAPIAFALSGTQPASAHAPAQVSSLPQIAFTTKKDGQWDLYTSNADGTDLVRLTDTPEREIRPAWSPNGKQLAFSEGQVAGRGVLVGSDGLFVINADGTGRKQLAAGPLFGWYWSPDSTMLAYSTVEAQRFCFYEEVTLHIVDVATGRKLAAIKNASFPVWLPNSDDLVFVGEGDGGGPGSHHVLSVKTGNVRPMTISSASFTRILPFIVSPKGDKLYWVGSATEGKGEWLLVTDMRGQNLVAVARLSGEIAFVSFRMFMSGYAGCDSPREVFRAWSPDGSQLAVLTIQDASAYADASRSDPLNLDVSLFQITVLAPGRSNPVVSTISYETLLSDYAAALQRERQQDLGPVRERHTGIVSVGWSGDGTKLLYAVADAMTRSGNYEWRFFWYRPSDGAKGELFGDSDPAWLAFLACCGQGRVQPRISPPAPTRPAAAYTITDLGTLGGSTSVAWGINGTGQVVGTAETAGGDQHAFIWDRGEMIDLGTLGGSASVARGINGAGQAVGAAETADGVEHAFLWDRGEMIDLGTLGGPTSFAVRINDAGQVVGTAQTADGAEHAFLWDDGEMVDLGTLPGFRHSRAVGLNAAGQVIGRAHDGRAQSSRAILWDKGEIIDLGTLSGPASVALGINDGGLVVGAADGADGVERAFLWDKGHMVDLGALPGGSTLQRAEARARTEPGVLDMEVVALPGGRSSLAWAINNNGQVVGAAETAGGDQHAFLWEKGVMTDLNGLIPSSTGWELFEARHINDAGRIVGIGRINRQLRGFLLTPVHAPAQ